MLLLTPLALAATPLEAALSELTEARWQASLDQTVYPDSPYRSERDLPPVIEVETSFQAFNDYYYFALVDGKVWYKPRFKRPAGEADWATELPWKPFGLRGGLPYRLEARSAEALDLVYADGMRDGFVEGLHFQTAEQADWERWIDVQGWERAGSWPWSQEIVFDADFTMPERIVALTADDDEIAVLSDERQMFYRRKVANLFVSTEWYEGWGQAKDLQVFFPEHLTDHRGWSLGRITAFGAGYKSGPDGRIFEWGPAAVSMETMVWLSEDGRVIYYLDSGTPPEVEHFVQPPLRGQWRGEAIDSSASTVLVIDRFGAVQTKIADFDLLGSTPTHPYCYFEECDDEPFYAPGDIRSGMSPIRLPSEGWTVHQPVLPPEAWSEETWITSAVTIVQTGKGNDERELRVVGMQEGELGSYVKRIDEAMWSFRPAATGDLGYITALGAMLQLEDLRRYSDTNDLADLHADEPVVDRRLSGQLAISNGQVLDLVIEDFNLQSSPWRVQLKLDGAELPMELHLVQAWNPYLAPHSGSEGVEIVTYEGTLTFDRAQVQAAMAGRTEGPQVAAVRKLLDRAKNQKFELIVNANGQGVELHTKRRRKTGPVSGVALAELSDAHDLRALEARFWSLQEQHMGWSAELQELSHAAAEDCEGGLAWAARVLALDDTVSNDLRGIRQIKGQARRFSWFTFATSGALYLFQLKTLDAALDNTRAWRSAKARPNELRFNVVTGVTSRIPYLAANISEVEGERLRAARDEHSEVRGPLNELVRLARQVGRDCKEHE
jgi:hypothetical protein